MAGEEKDCALHNAIGPHDEPSAVEICRYTRAGKVPFSINPSPPAKTEINGKISCPTPIQLDNSRIRHEPPEPPLTL